MSNLCSDISATIAQRYRRGDGPPQVARPLTISVGIATRGRNEILREVLAQLAKQTRKADEIIVCGTNPDDVTGVPADALTLVTTPGSCRQRNAILEAASGEILVFFDDDFLPRVDYLAAIEHYMSTFPDVALVTGLVLADGISGPGLSVPEACALLASGISAPGHATPTYGGYGCNMAIRLDTQRQHRIFFDECLPLYGWQEDVDFSRRLAPFGAIMHINAAAGVHLGTKTGRTSGKRLGYSQIANPIYLWRKRQGYSRTWGLRHVAKNIAMNLARSLRPEPYVDRRGRVVGNVLALKDLVTGRLEPGRVLEL